MKRAIQKAIRSFGVTEKYKGFNATVDGVLFIIEVQEMPIKITKDLYPALARKYHTSIRNIEHNMRWITTMCWEKNRKRLEEMAGYPLDSAPGNKEFLSILAFYVTRRNAS